MGVQQQSAKQTKLIAALKQYYERYHAGDLAVLKELYEYHAQNCVRAAGLTVDPGRREEYQPDLGERWPSRLVATAEADGLIAIVR